MIHCHLSGRQCETATLTLTESPYRPLDQPLQKVPSRQSRRRRALVDLSHDDEAPLRNPLAFYTIEGGREAVSLSIRRQRSGACRTSRRPPPSLPPSLPPSFAVIRFIASRDGSH